MNHVVPKREASVHLRLASGDTLAGCVFLDFIDGIHRGAQTLLDKLNGDAEWVPFRDGSRMEMINRPWIVSVQPGDGMTADLVRRETSPVFRRESVTVRLPGSTLDGLIAMDLPDEFSRVSDFLNFPDLFFALETDDGPVLVAKRHVLGLAPHEKPPALPQTLGERRSARS